MKKKMFSLLTLCIITVFAYFVIGGFDSVSVDSPTANTNYSGNLLLNATVAGTGENNATNVTFYFINATSGALVYENTALPNNLNINDTFNVTINTAAVLGDGIYNLTVNATNSTKDTIENSTITNVQIDNNAPLVSTFNSPTSGTYYNASFVINVTITGTPTTVQYQLENGTNSSNVGSWVSMSNPSGNYWNATINVSATNDWNYTININATDVAGNSNTTETIDIGIDDTNPTNVSVSCDTITAGDSRSCTCTANDSSEDFGGSLTYSYSGDDTTTAGTTTATCTATDLAGNTNSSTATYTVNAASSGSSSSSGAPASGTSATSTVPDQFAKTVWTSIDGGEKTTLGVEGDNVGITDVEFETTEKVWGAWMKVQKKTTLPASVKSLQKKTYKYIEITKGVSMKDNLLQDIVIKFKVTETWLKENGLNPNNVALYRYHNDEWIQLPTTQGKSQGTFIHYTATTLGFSYFAIGEGLATGTVPSETIPNEEEQTNQDKEISEETKKTVDVKPKEEVKEEKKSWPYVILVLIIIAVVIGYWYYTNNIVKKK